MNHLNILDKPEIYASLEAKCKEIGFTMPSDLLIGTLLKTLVRSKPGGNFLELGTGIGLSLSWMVEGMDEASHLISVDNDPQLIDIARQFFGANSQVELVCTDGAEWLKANSEWKFDLVFADAWPGKYGELDEVLAMIKPGGFYVIDDMLPQPNWPEGHAEKAEALIESLENRKDLILSKMEWSTGVIIAVKR
ncbi:MAG: class I SAM-dependent methyltransferase [Bacteroidota bacterium]